MRENWSMKTTEGASNIIYHQQQVTREATNGAGSNISISRFHRAAIDGYVDMLCDASKRDTNLPNADLDGLTPTLLAARSGHLDALRILVGRGGDPERTCTNGSSALHLASARGHLNCVSFLVNFGANMWSLDNDLHTAKDVAAMEQRKEVLDFLDSMMAKQSALNTKNVQKLKERAKVAAEKRLKLLRKAQLKAIKQVEKDERYLKKLSHNRQLLKAAHSISDIKLVGRHTSQPLNCGSQQAAAGYLSSGGESGLGGGAGSSLSSSSRLGSSPSLSNLINHKLQMDLLMSRSRQHSGQLNQQTRLLLSRRSTAGSSSCTTTDAESSAYSTSSVSSSAAGGRTSPKRPKYSDLVAVNGAELVARWQGKKIPSNVQQEQQSLKSTSVGSTIGTKFWGIGGVSRKVQLRRLLRAGAAQSSSDLTNISASTTGGAGQRQEKGGSDATGNKGAQAAIGDRLEGTDDGIGAGGKSSNNDGRMGSTASNKLCQVQPTMRLKLNAPVERIQPPEGKTTTKWPPQMMMTRAISEPDFRAALRQGDEDDDVRGEKSDHEVGDEIRPEQAGRLSPTSSGQQQQQQRIEATEFNHESWLITSESTSGGNLCQKENGKEEAEAFGLTQHHYPNQAANNDRDDSQHQLLTQCLSQLKLRHEELTMRNQDGDDLLVCSEFQTRINDQQQQQRMLLRPSKSANGAKAFSTSRQMISGGGDFFDSSDELIKHQLMAGEFPLRPSLIKQKQQQLTKDQILPNLRAINAGKGSRNNDNNNKASDCVGRSTTISVDSIGSAGSFAKRNASSDKSSSLSASYSSSSACSTSSSSVETEFPETKNIKRPSLDEAARANAHHHHQPSVPAGAEPLPPLPPPLPPKTLSLTGARVNLSHHAASHRSQPHQQVSCNNDDTESTIKMFLESNGLEDLSEVFAREKIDLEALMLLNEEDLKSLNILLGPRRKLLKAIATRKRWAKSRKEGGGEINNNNVTKPMYIMVDTQL